MRFSYVCVSGNDYLRAPDQKYRESHDRSEISYFILFHQKYLFGKLFSKIIIKSSSAFWFFQKLQKFKIRLEACLRPRKQGKLWRPVLVKIVVIKLPHKSVFSVTVLLFMSLLCIFIGGTNFFLRWLLIFF